MSALADGVMSSIPFGMVMELASMTPRAQPTIWLNDDLVDDNFIQALTPNEFIDLLAEAVRGDAGPDNPFAPYVAFERPEADE